MISFENYASAQSPLQQVDAYLQKLYKPHEPGIAIAVSENGKVVFQKGYGITSLETPSPITASTNFNIASVTKQFTAVAILQLANKKLLSLNDPIIKFFPDFNPVTGNNISIRHLLTHSSGLVDHYAQVDTKNLKHASDHDVLKAVKNIDTLYFPAGSQYRYSNTAYCLLALVIEKLSGLTYADYIRKNIFIPLGMSHSTVLIFSQSIAQRATGYEWDQASGKFVTADAGQSVFFSTEGDGGIYTSVNDYLKWLNGLQQASILPAAFIQQARSIQFMIDSAKNLGYGFGWFVGDKEKPEVVYHTGSNGGFRSIVFTIPSKGYAMIIFSNRTGIDLENLAAEINKILRVENKSFARVESLVSFQECWPIFAPCKKIRSFLISFAKSWTGNAMALN